MKLTAPKSNKKIIKPQTESSMKGLIDLYKVINDALYCRIQDQVPNSEAIGLTKEQRTRLASQETRSDANKAMYYKIQHDIIEKEKDEGEVNVTEEKLMSEAQKVVDLTDKINKLTRATTKANAA